MKTEIELKKSARLAASEKAEAARLAAENAATLRRFKFMDLEPKFTAYACQCRAIACGWCDGDRRPLRSDEAAAERSVLAAAHAIEQVEKGMLL